MEKQLIDDYQRNLIWAFCSMYGSYTINKCTIDKYGSVDIDGSLCIYYRKDAISKMPFKINIISGDFHCIGNGLTTLEDFPKFIDGEIKCYDNPFPVEVIIFLSLNTQDNIKTFLKYQDDFEVWTPSFNKENFNDLVLEIEEGLL